MLTCATLDSPAIQAVLTHRLWDYALRRQQAVQAGHKTADLAGVLVQHFGSGLVEVRRESGKEECRETFGYTGIQ